MLFDRVKENTKVIIKHKRKHSRANKAGQVFLLLIQYITLFLSALAISVVMCAQNSNLYMRIQEKCGLFEGEHAEDRRAVIAMNESIADFLSGRTQRIENASERADLHMRDVKKIFDGTEKAGLILFAFAVLLLMSANRRRGIRQTVYISLLPIVFAFLIIVVLAFSDFSELFYGFHELAFDNDLWLLNPAEDFLIRCLPEAFFYRMALRVLLRALFLYGIFCLITFHINKFGRRD